MLTTAIVTGAASGVGRACAEMLLADNVRIAVMDVQAEALGKAFSNRAERAFVHAVDIGDPTATQAAVGQAIEQLGHVDALLHFAAAWTGNQWDRSAPAEWDRILGINLKGTFFLCQAVARHMVERKQGCIVLTGSDSAKVGGFAGGPAYVASKGGILGLTRVLATSLARHGIRVNAINPGALDTAMTASWPAEVKQMIVSRTPMGRLGRPEDIAGVACFLASDRAGFMTGEVVEVNGGSYLD